MPKNCSFTLKFSDNDFRAYFSPSIQLNWPTELALISIDLYNVFPNITKTNNIFRWSEIKNGEKEWKEIEVPVDYYDADSLLDYLNGNNKKPNKPFIIKYDEKLLKFEINLGKDVTVDFSHKRSMNILFGFNKMELTEKSNKSSSIPDLDPIKNVFVECDIVNGNENYLNGDKSKVIFNFPVDCDMGEKIRAEPYNLLYVSTVTNIINDIGVSLKDSEGNLLNLNNSTVVLKLHLRGATS